jgi:hypothetical protein
LIAPAISSLDYPDKVRKDVAGWVESLLRNASIGEWELGTFNSTFDDGQNPALNAIQANVVMAYFVDKAITKKQELPSVVYMCILGVRGFLFQPAYSSYNFPCRYFTNLFPPGRFSRRTFTKVSAAASKKK